MLFKILSLKCDQTCTGESKTFCVDFLFFLFVNFLKKKRESSCVNTQLVCYTKLDFPQTSLVNHACFHHHEDKKNGGV